jgi:hypothetical protein
VQTTHRRLSILKIASGDEVAVKPASHFFHVAWPYAPEMGCKPLIQAGQASFNQWNADDADWADFR